MAGMESEVRLPEALHQVIIHAADIMLNF